MTLVLQSFLLFRVLPVYLVAVLIEQRNSTKRSLHESEARFRVMANSAPVLIWESGLDKVCAFFNSRWLEFTGRSLEQEIGNGWLEGIHPDDVAMCLESYSSAFDARCPFEIEYRLRRHDGEYRWIEDRGVPRYDSNGEFCGFIGSGIDISERKQAETNNAYLAHMQRLVLVGELSATIAHEVRQPLQAITLHANTGAMLLSSSTPALGELREIVAEIEEDARRADDVIDRIRNFLGRRDPAMETLDMNAIVTEVARLVSDEARKRRVDVRLRLSGTVLQVLGDRTEIMQVLLNLILNGMDAMETGVEAERRLTLQTERHAALVRVSVRDRGTGISPERMKHLFDPFFTTKSGGMGLGLSIAKSIIYRHSGRIWADNNPDTGATFYFELPVLDTN
jgi:PAS domain S-box-containing protein